MLIDEHLYHGCASVEIMQDFGMFLRNCQQLATTVGCSTLISRKSPRLYDLSKAFNRSFSSRSPYFSILSRTRPSVSRSFDNVKSRRVMMAHWDFPLWSEDNCRAS